MPPSTTDTSPQARLAESILQRRLRRLDDGLEKVGKFATNSGRRIALMRQFPGIALFAEIFPEHNGLDGVHLVLDRSNGRYGRTDPRDPAVWTDSRLGKGCEAFHLLCRTPSALGRFLDWYEEQ